MFGGLFLVVWSGLFVFLGLEFLMRILGGRPSSKYTTVTVSIKGENNGMGGLMKNYHRGRKWGQ